LIWVPANHKIVSLRALLWGFCAIASAKEWYEFSANPHCHRLGPFAWLTNYICLVELSIVYKFRGQEFVNPFPWWIYTIWAVLISLWLVGLIKAVINGRRNKEEKFNPYNPSISIKSVN
jgi:hypothetical protein